MTHSERALLASFGPLDLLTAALCVVAALLALTCARNPMYHSSRRRRRHEARFWGVVTAVLLAVTVYQILGMQVLVHTIGIRFLQTVADHGMSLKHSFYAAAGIVLLLALVFFYASVGASIKRNALASTGLLAIAVAMAIGIWAVGADARRLAAGDPTASLGSMQVGGFMAGALLVIVAAIIYRRNRANQNQWRNQLGDTRPDQRQRQDARNVRRRSDKPTRSRSTS